MGDKANLQTDAPKNVGLIIHNGYVITMDDESQIIEDGAIAIDGNRFIAVGGSREIMAKYRASRMIDAKRAPVHPGFIECHLHASFQTFRSALPDQMPENQAFDTFESAFYNTVNDEEEYLAVVLASMEMIRNGTTCFLEAGTMLEPSMAARGAELVGIRAVISDAFIWDQPQGFAQGMIDSGCEGCNAAVHARPTLARAPQTRGEALANMGGELYRNSDRDALVTAHIAILGLGTASEELMMEAKRRADAAGVVLNLHQSYSPADTEADRQRFGGKDPLVHLAQTGFLGRNIVFGHANHLTDAECDAILEHGPSIAWAPGASMMWGHGAAFTVAMPNCSGAVPTLRLVRIWRIGRTISICGGRQALPSFRPATSMATGAISLPKTASTWRRAVVRRPVAWIILSARSSLASGQTSSSTRSTVPR